MRKTQRLTVEEIIHKAVEAQRVANERQSRDAFKATEARLYAMPSLEKKIIRDREKLDDLRENGSPRRNMSIVRFQRPGYRVDPEELLEAIIQDLEARIAADEHEIVTVREAMEPFKEDPYYLTVIRRYMDRRDDEDIAIELNCSATQIWKQRGRIVTDISIMLYGSFAL